LSIKRALVSVHDKAGLVDFCKGLNELDIEIVSSGGTAEALKKAGIKVTLVSEITGYPEILDGRVKTLHPSIHGALLALRGNKAHMETLTKHKITPIDMVVVNLYPFEATVAKGADMAEAMENMDIGGPSMIRSAAKNHKFVVVIVSPDQYAPILEMLRQKGDVAEEMRGELAREALLHTSSYDIAIHDYLSRTYKTKDKFPKTVVARYEKVQECRYGENAHQCGAFYRLYGVDRGLLKAKQLHGKELSFNNFLDMNDALRIVVEFKEPTVAVMKHANPCGVATRKKILDAYKVAFDVDAKSAFGGVVGLNRIVDKDTAEEIGKVFIEVVIAPGYTKEALEILEKKKNIRLMEIPENAVDWDELDMKKVFGGVLYQTYDHKEVTKADLKVVSKRHPTDQEVHDLLFAWKIVRNVKSNAIVLVKADTTVGIGAGQMSRVDSAEIAVKKSAGKCVGSVMASDAFFPFRDALDVGGKNGVTAVIHPGGSIRDQEVIDAANEYNIAMVYTGIRAFRH
jgi:phosphoribosylaminoimidazolecarboxamide formyltransferase / IMP cyclohydrolase